MCKTARVPEISVSSIAVNGQRAQGVTREQPVKVVYANPFSITVIADRDYTVYDQLRAWFETSAENANPFDIQPVALGPNTINSNSQNQRMGYYDTLVRQIVLEKMEYMTGDEFKDRKERQTYMSPFRIQFNNAHISRIGEIQLDSQANDTLIEFAVDFAYETYTYLREDVMIEERN